MKGNWIDSGEKTKSNIIMYEIDFGEQVFKGLQDAENEKLISTEELSRHPLRESYSYVNSPCECEIISKI